MTSRFVIPVLAAVSLVGPSMLGAATLWDSVEALPKPPGAPRHSDVIMRTLRLRAASATDDRDTFKAMDAFHVTRLEWSYLTDVDAVRRIRESGRLFGGAISAPTYCPSPGDSEWFDRVVIKDRTGSPIIAPWKRAWSRTLWGCMNNHELERGHIEAAQRYIDLGATVLQRDEPNGNLLATRWGGCFCSDCIEGFREFLKQRVPTGERKALGLPENLKDFDYAEHLARIDAPVGDAFARWEGGRLKELFETFQLESTLAFHRRVRKALDGHAGRRVPISCNNGAHRWSGVEMEFDWAFGELSFSQAQPIPLLETFERAARARRLQVVTMPKSSSPANLADPRQRIRPTIATAYALGGWCMAPWDVYMPGDTPRYFGRPEDYADLFGFVRGIAEQLDGHALAAVGGAFAFQTRSSTGPVVAPAWREIAATVRIRPDAPGSPAVIHLVDWSKDPRPFDLAFRAEHLNPARPVRARLLRPVPYEAEDHAQARESGDFSALVETIPLEAGYRSQWKLPALDPWGVVVIEQDSTAPAGGIWQPVIEIQGAELTPTPEARLTCATPGAVIRYTLDGSEPSAASSSYQEPLGLTPPATVRARAFMNGRSSMIATRNLGRTEFSPPLASNGDFETGFDQWSKRSGGKAKMKAVVAPAHALDGSPAARIEILKSDGVPYHLRLLQEFRARKDRSYTLRFTAWSDKPTRIRVGMQGVHSPHTVVGMGMIELGTTPQTYLVTGHQDGEDMSAYIQFDLGAAEPGRTVWIDRVALHARE